VVTPATAVHVNNKIAILSIVSLSTLWTCGSLASAPVAMDTMPHVPSSVADWARGAMLFEGMGTVHRRVTTSSPLAQKYFDQGLRFMWAFNHDEATRSFAKAALLDPACAACFWGVSLTVGPNYNLPFLIEERAKVASEALAKAMQKSSRASPVEQALISALAKRYPTAAPLDPAAARPVFIAYAEAMKSVALRFPYDLDVQTLYAEALMNINAWKLWTPDGRPAAGTQEIVATLEGVLKRDPQHPGANHYYIHAMEASPHPERALAAAERAKTLMPAAGHLVHMPAHILQRVGRYEDAAEANRVAAVADQSYEKRTQPPDYYPVMYTAHNYQFLAYSAAMEGRRAETMAATDDSRRAVSDEMLVGMPGADWYVAETYTARVRFGLWDEVLAMPAPNPKLPGLTGAYLFARAVALAAKGRVDDAQSALANLQQFASALPADAPAGQNSLKELLAIAVPIAQARIASAKHRNDEALTLLRQAVDREDRIAYDEPKNWFFPARHLLGALLLQTGQAREAEVVYREDLRQSPANGWALFGLSAALKAQGRAGEAARVTQQFESAWTHADVTLTASAF
jgi:tetratricopeptide (TPR) repeat protein